MIPFNYGDVVLVKFPFTNLKTTKQRPAVVISSLEYHDNRPNVILMAITSQIHSPLSVGEARLKNWKEAGLLKPSAFKPLIATLEREQIIKVLGHITNRDQNHLNKIIRFIIGNSFH